MNHPFAPGAITRHTRRIGTPAQRRELVKWIYVAGVMGALALILGFSAGVLQ